MNDATINDRRIILNELVEIIHCHDVAVTTQSNKLRFWTLKLDKIGKKINMNKVIGKTSDISTIMKKAINAITLTNINEILDGFLFREELSFSFQIIKGSFFPLFSIIIPLG